MDWLYSIPSFLVAIAILVAVHEFGHFYIARRCGVHVIRFSLGFGKVLWRRYDNRGTEYTLSALPFGGYVKMLDEREGNVAIERIDQTFNRKTVWQRMAIVLAGPIANFILAIVLFWVLLLQGERGLIPIIGAIKPDSIAAKAGLEVGQEIVAIDNIETPTEQLVQKQLINRLGESGSLLIKVTYPNSSLSYEITATLDHWLQGEKDPDPLAGIGIEIPPIAAIVGKLLPEKPAERAGFQLDDKITHINGVSVKDWRDFQNGVKSHAGESVEVVVERKAVSGIVEPITLRVIPESFSEKGVSYGRVGMAPKELSPELLRIYEYSVVGALGAGIKKTLETSGFVLLSVKKLILGEISTKNLSGPISIAKVAGSSAQNGLKSFIGFVALLSVFLGVFNLLPVPVLDGGHLVYLYLEAFRGKPVSEKMQVMGFQAGLFVVISLSMLAMYNDIMRL